MVIKLENLLYILSLSYQSFDLINSNSFISILNLFNSLDGAGLSNFAPLDKSQNARGLNHFFQHKTVQQKKVLKLQFPLKVNFFFAQFTIFQNCAALGLHCLYSTSASAFCLILINCLIDILLPLCFQSFFVMKFQS